MMPRLVLSIPSLAPQHAELASHYVARGSRLGLGQRRCHHKYTDTPDVCLVHSSFSRIGWVMSLPIVQAAGTCVLDGESGERAQEGSNSVW